MENFDKKADAAGESVRPLTREEIIICRLYLEDMDEHKTCNEYKLLRGLLDGRFVVRRQDSSCSC